MTDFEEDSSDNLINEESDRGVPDFTGKNRPQDNRKNVEILDSGVSAVMSVSLSSGRKGRMLITVYRGTPRKARMRALSSGITKCLRTLVEAEISILPWRSTYRQKFKRTAMIETTRLQRQTPDRRAMGDFLNRPAERAAP